MGKSKKNRDYSSTRTLLGKKVFYIGLLGASKACHFCGAKKHKGMFSEYNNNFYCNEDCIKMSAGA